MTTEFERGVRAAAEWMRGAGIGPMTRKHMLTFLLPPASSGAGGEPDYKCQDCIGMKDHGCYCQAMGATAPGGPATPDPRGCPISDACPAQGVVAQSRPVTLANLSNALSCFWNAALGTRQNGSDPVGCMAEGIQAVAWRLQEHDARALARPADGASDDA